MDDINSIIETFQKIEKTEINSYENLGSKLAKLIITMPSAEQIMSWELVATHITNEKHKKSLTKGASFYLNTEEEKSNFVQGIAQLSVDIASLDNNITILKDIKNSKATDSAVVALEELRSELNKKYKKSTMH